MEKNDLEDFLDYLGWIPGEEVFILRFYDGKTIHHNFHIKERNDLVEAIKIINLLDGKSQIYISLNPHIKDIDPNSFGNKKTIKCVKNILIDIDSDHSKDLPANSEEIGKLKDTVEFIEKWLKGFGVNYMQSFTGNGFRFIIPVPATNKDIEVYIKEFIHKLANKVDFIDKNVSDCSRITGVPGTRNVKSKEDPKTGRVNRMRQISDVKRVESPFFLEELHKLDIEENTNVYTGDIELDNIEELVRFISEKSIFFKSILKRARVVRTGKRSEIDWAIVSVLKDLDISENNIKEILIRYGTSKTKDPDYVNITTQGALRL